MDTAPNFQGSYPMAGELIGPAWQAAWDALADSPKTKTELRTVMAAAGVAEKTADTLLRKAERAKKITVEYRRLGSRTHAVCQRSKINEKRS